MQIHASLAEWQRGVHYDIAFSADTFVDVYKEHMFLLLGIKDKRPDLYHVLMHCLYNQAA